MSTSPAELMVFDFDGTLYRSPGPPPGHLTWPFQVYSLDGWGLPGFDRRWNLTAITAGRQAANRGALLTILTARPDYSAMRTRIEEMASATGLSWSAVQLRPVTSLHTNASFKASVLSGWLQQMPSIRTVTMWEDDEANLEAARLVVERSGRRFIPQLVRFD